MVRLTQVERPTNRRPTLTPEDQWQVLAVLAARHPNRGIGEIHEAVTWSARHLVAGFRMEGMKYAAARRTMLLNEADRRIRGAH